MNKLQIFNNDEFGEIRTAVVNNEPMFCLIDICKALELSNSRIVADRLDEDERRKLDLPRQGETWFVTESGLYAVILRSDKPNAKKFRKWVTSEVLPSIRKTGSYNKPMSTAEKIQLLAQGNEELNERVDMVDGRVTDLENNMTLDYGQQVVIGDEVNKVVINALSGKNSAAYKEIGRKVFSECNSDIKHYFHVNARNNIPKKRFDEAVQYIQKWHPCTNTQILINEINSENGVRK
jgi:prophage antirepressor-like protein